MQILNRRLGGTREAITSPRFVGSLTSTKTTGSSLGGGARQEGGQGPHQIQGYYYQSDDNFLAKVGENRGNISDTVHSLPQGRACALRGSVSVFRTSDIPCVFYAKFLTILQNFTNFLVPVS